MTTETLTAETTPPGAAATPGVVASPGGDLAALAPDDLAAVRELVLRAHPAVVPELVAGGSVAELMASVAAAEAAYQRIAAVVGGPAAAVAAPPLPRVPAGDVPAAVIDAERLPAAEKIRRGLVSRRG